MLHEIRSVALRTLFALSFAPLPGCIGCVSCVDDTIAADPPLTVINDASWAPDLAYGRMSTRYQATHTQAQFEKAVLALPHVREEPIAVAQRLDRGDERILVEGYFDTRAGTQVPFRAVVVREPGRYACDGLTVASVPLR